MYIRILFFIFLLCHLFSQENLITVDAETLANIVIEVNKLKQSNKILEQEINLLKNLSKNKNFSIVKHNHFIVPLIVHSSNIFPDSEKMSALSQEIENNIPGSIVIQNSSISIDIFSEINMLLSVFAKKSNKAFWYSQFSFMLNRENWNEIPPNSKIFTKIFNKNMLLITKYKNSWLGYQGFKYQVDIKNLDRYKTKKIKIQNANVFTKFTYDKQTNYSYISLYFQKKHKEELLRNLTSLPGFPILESKIHPKSIIFLQFTKNNSQIWKYLNSLSFITIGPCFSYSSKKIHTEKILCFSLNKNFFKKDNINYIYEFIIDGKKLPEEAIEIKKLQTRLVYHLRIPREAKNLQINEGYSCRRISCDDIYPGMYLGKMDQISLIALKKHLNLIQKDPAKKWTVLHRLINSSRFNKKAKQCYYENFDDFIAYIKTWKKEQSEEQINLLIKKLIEIRDIK